MECMMVLTVFQRFACLQPSARVACHVPQGANCCNANAATVSDTVTAIGDKDAESVRKLVEGLWNAYDKNGDGALEASECDTIQLDVMNGLLPLLTESKKRHIDTSTYKFGELKPEQLESIERKYALKEEKLNARIAELQEKPDGGEALKKLTGCADTDKTISKKKFTKAMVKYINETITEFGVNGFDGKAYDVDGDGRPG